MQRHSTFIVFVVFSTLCAHLVWADSEEITKISWSNSQCSQAGVKQYFQAGYCYNYNTSGDNSSVKYYNINSVIYELMYLEVGCASNVDYNIYNTSTCIQGANNGSFMFFADSSSTTSLPTSSSSSTSSSTAATLATTLATTAPPPSTVSTTTTGGGNQLIIIQTFNQSSNQNQCSGAPLSRASVVTGECYNLGGMPVRYFAFGNVVKSCTFPDSQCSENQKCVTIGSLNTCSLVDDIYYLFTLSTTPTAATTAIATTTGQAVSVVTSTTSDASRIFVQISMLFVLFSLFM